MKDSLSDAQFRKDIHLRHQPFQGGIVTQTALKAQMTLRDGKTIAISILAQSPAGSYGVAPAHQFLHMGEGYFPMGKAGLCQMGNGRLRRQISKVIKPNRYGTMHIIPPFYVFEFYLLRGAVQQKDDDDRYHRISCPADDLPQIRALYVHDRHQKDGRRHADGTDK